MTITNTSFNIGARQAICLSTTFIYILLEGDGLFGGAAIVTGAAVSRSRNASNCRSDNALCKVSNGRIAGTPPKPSNAAGNQNNCVSMD